MRQVFMLRPYLNLMKGEIAGFPPETAADLINRGIARAYDAAAEARRKAAEQAAAAEAKRKAEEEAAAAEAKRKAEEEAAAEAKRKAEDEGAKAGAGDGKGSTKK